jgi:hypothetical protein
MNKRLFLVEVGEPENPFNHFATVTDSEKQYFEAGVVAQKAREKPVTAEQIELIIEESAPHASKYYIYPAILAKDIIKKLQEIEP